MAQHNTPKKNNRNNKKKIPKSYFILSEKFQILNDKVPSLWSESE